MTLLYPAISRSLLLAVAVTGLCQATPVYDRPHFNLELFEAHGSRKVESYAPSEHHVIDIFTAGRVHKDFRLTYEVETPEAGSAEVDITGDALSVVFNAQPSGCRMTFGFGTVESEGMDLRDFQNGALEFSIKGPAGTMIELTPVSGSTCVCMWMCKHRSSPGIWMKKSS